MRCVEILTVIFCLPMLAGCGSPNKGDDVLTPSAKGDKSFQIGDYAGAITYSSEAIRRNPSDAHAYITRGAARQANDDLDGAIADFSAAIRLDPTRDSAFHCRGLSYLQRG